MAQTFGSLIQQGGDILTADARVAADARHKLSDWLRQELQTQLDAAKTFSTAQDSAEGNRRTDSREVQKAYEAGDDMIRKVSKWLNSLDADDNIPAQRAFYGLGPNLPPTFRHEEIEKMLEKFVGAQTAVGINDDAKLSQTRLDKIVAMLDVIDAKSENAGVGDRANITGEKLKARDGLDEAISRVRYSLWSTLPEMFKDPLLHNYGFVPRQESATERAEPPLQSPSS